MQELEIWSKSLDTGWYSVSICSPDGCALQSRQKRMGQELFPCKHFAPLRWTTFDHQKHHFRLSISRSVRIGIMKIKYPWTSPYLITKKVFEIFPVKRIYKTQRIAKYTFVGDSWSHRGTIDLILVVRGICYRQIWWTPTIDHLQRLRWLR